MLPPFQGDFGAAYLLRTQPSADFEIRTSDFVVRIRRNASFITIEMTGTAVPADVRGLAWSRLQDVLDLHAARTRQIHSTHSGERGYVTWHRARDGYDVTYVETADSGWSASGMIVGSGPPAPPSSLPIHHPALRFYRLSQASDDLFDAYRNAYLAFECLISDESAKGKSESELKWLIRVSKANFAAAIPSGIDIDTVLTEIYKLGRLPLFHAKMSETFFTPQGSEREQVQKLLEDLTFLLVSFLRHKLGSHAVVGWGEMSQAVYDAQSKVTFDCDAVLLRSGLLRRTVTPTIDVFDKPRRFENLWARITVHPPLWLPSLSKIETRLKRQPRIYFRPEESICLSSVSTFTIELNVINRHAQSPKRLHLA